MTKINPEIMLAVSDLYYKGMLNIIIQSPTQKEAEELKQSILQNQEIVERLRKWLDDVPKGDARIIKIKSANEACSKNQMEEMEIEHQKIIARQEVRRELNSFLNRNKE